MNKLNKEELNKVAGGSEKNGKWYFRIHYLDSDEYSEWSRGYDSKDDEVIFINEYPVSKLGRYEIESKFIPETNAIYG